MRRSIIGILGGLACAAALSAYAVTSGGLPSRPWLQALGVGEAAPAAAGNVAIAKSLGVGTAASGTTGEVDALAPQNSKSAINVTVANDQTICMTVNYSGSAGACSMPSPDSGIALGLNAPFTFYNVSQLYFGATPMLTSGRFNATASGCPVDTGSDYFNIAGCVRNGAGEYTVSFINAFATKPVCTATYNTPSSAVWDMITETAVTTTSAQFLEVNSAGTVSDYGAFGIICL